MKGYFVIVGVELWASHFKLILNMGFPAVKIYLISLIIYKNIVDVIHKSRRVKHLISPWGYCSDLKWHFNFPFNISPTLQLDNFNGRSEQSFQINNNVIAKNVHICNGLKLLCICFENGNFILRIVFIYQHNFGLFTKHKICAIMIEPKLLVF